MSDIGPETLLLNSSAFATQPVTPLMVLYGKVAGYPWKIEIQTYYKPFKIVKSMIIFPNLRHNRLREAVFSVITINTSPQ